MGVVTWGVALESVSLSGGHKLSNHRMATILDTGTSTLMLPPSVIENFEQYLATRPELSCSDISQFPTIRLDLGGKMHEIPPENYIVMVQGDSFVEKGGEFHTSFSDAWKQLKEWLPISSFLGSSKKTEQQEVTSASLAAEPQCF